MHIYLQEQQGGSNNPVTFKKRARTYQSVLRHRSLQQRAAMTRSPIHDSCSCISIVCLSISVFSLLSVCMFVVPAVVFLVCQVENPMHIISESATTGSE
jgi:hypothetical protein